MMVKIIRRLEESGELRELLAAGLISTKTVAYYRIWQEIDKQARTTAKARMQIITEVADKFRASQNTVYRALKIFEEDESRSTDTDARRPA